MSGIRRKPRAPSTIVTPSPVGAYIEFYGDGTEGTTLGNLYKMDSSRVVSAVVSVDDEQIRDAIGTALTDSSTIDFTPNDPGDTISAAVIDGSITSTKIADGTIVNADVNAAAAIAYAKLNLSAGIVNGDINAAAAIAYAKLALTGSIVNADLSAAAAIAYSKLNLTTSIVNGDISGSAAIAYSKLNLATSIVNADINAAAAIAYSKLVLTSSIVNADISAAAAIALSKLATQADKTLLGNVSGGAASPTALSLAQARALICPFASSMTSTVTLTAGTGNVLIASFLMPALTLVNNGDSIVAEFWGSGTITALAHSVSGRAYIGAAASGLGGTLIGGSTTTTAATARTLAEFAMRFVLTARTGAGTSTCGMRAACSQSGALFAGGTNAATQPVSTADVNIDSTIAREISFGWQPSAATLTGATMINGVIRYIPKTI